RPDSARLATRPAIGAGSDSRGQAHDAGLRNLQSTAGRLRDDPQMGLYLSRAAGSPLAALDPRRSRGGDGPAPAQARPLGSAPPVRDVRGVPPPRENGPRAGLDAASPARFRQSPRDGKVDAARPLLHLYFASPSASAARPRATC